MPVAMSLLAAALIPEYLLRVGHVRQADEGLEAHLFQMLLVTQMPVAGYFALRHLPDAPKATLIVCGLQAMAGALALGLLYWFEHS